MGNVGAIYIGRTVTNTTALKLYVLVLSSVALWKLIWVHKVFENFIAVEKHGLSSIMNYILYSLQHTSASVQATLFVGAVAFVTLAIDIASATQSRLQVRLR